MDGRSSRVIDSLETELKNATDSIVVADICAAIYDRYKFEELRFFPNEYDYLVRALNIYEKAGVADKAAYICNALAGVHYNLHQTDKARHFWLYALDLYTRSGNRTRQAAIYNNLSIVALSALERKDYLEKAIGLQKEYKDTAGLATSVHNLGSWYFSRGNLEEAEKNFRETIYLARSVNKVSSQQAAYLWLGIIRQKQGKFREAIQYIKRSIAFNSIREADDPNVVLAYQTLAELYAAIHDHEQAYKYQSKLLTIKDTLFQEQQMRGILELEARYETEKKEEQIELLKKNEASKTRALEAEQKQRVYLTFLLAMAITGAMITVILYVQLRKNKAKIEYQNSALTRLNKTKDRFFRIIAHDLRNPLVSFSGLFKLLHHYAMNGEMQKLKALQVQTSRSIADINHLLDNLLDWASSQTGTLPYHPEPLALKHLYEELTSLFGQSAQAKEIRLGYHLDSDLYIFADRNGVSTILRNLVSNAIKFTPCGGEVNLTGIRENDGHIKLAITDTGKGMDHLLIKALFNREQMQTMEGTLGEKGTGLGIRICQEFIELNNGLMDVRSEVDKGTTFYISLPAFCV